jgi:hypothetical protein
VEIIPPEHVIKSPRSQIGPEWSIIYPDGFNKVRWSFGDAPNLACNGIRISSPKQPNYRFDWPLESLKSPKIDICDSDSNLPLTTQRYELLQNKLPFFNEITRDVVFSFIAHALICGPLSQASTLFCYKQHPLRQGRNIRKPFYYSEQFTHSSYSLDSESALRGNNFFDDDMMRLCASRTEFFPLEPWFYSFKNVNSCQIFGFIRGYEEDSFPVSVFNLSNQIENSISFHWNLSLESRDIADILNFPLILTKLAFGGIKYLKQDVISSNIW